ncbi:MAG: hypothetical protein RLZZ419_1698 [Pseudomonadota bacterium]|jgi:hypothetical protein
MFSTPRLLLVIVLTMLQFIAPLVHAHASKDYAHQGLHVPGLEGYDVEHNTLVSQMKILPDNISVNGIIVAVDMGIKQSQTKARINSDSHYYLNSKILVFNAVFLRFNANFSPQPQQLAYCLFIPSPPSRAPPVQ